MSLINIQNSTIITGVTSTGTWLVTEFNNKSVGVPLYTFSYSTPCDLDFIEMIPCDFDVSNATIYDSATAYGAGVATFVNSSAFAFPIFKLLQDSNIDQIVEFTQPTLVTSLTSTGSYVAVKVNGTGYGIPLYLYSSVFPFATSVAMSAIDITTKINKKIKDVGIDNPSTNLNHKIQTYTGLINRVKYQLGHPFVNLEICDNTQMVDFIDKSIEWYTKYAGFTEEYLIFNSELYTEPGLRLDKLFSATPSLRSTFASGASACWDYDLGDYRKVVGVFEFAQGETTGINTLFTLEQAMAQQTYFSYMLGNVGFDLVTWEVLKGWLKLREKMLAQIPYIDFDARNQTLRLIPPPGPNARYLGVVGCWVEKPIKDLIMERWIENYTLALTKIAIASTRGKYQSIQLFGGGTISYNDFLTQGLAEKKALEEELMNGYGEVTPARFFIGVLTALILPAWLFIQSSIPYLI
jgi:hypothetical protein